MEGLCFLIGNTIPTGKRWALHAPYWAEVRGFINWKVVQENQNHISHRKSASEVGTRLVLPGGIRMEVWAWTALVPASSGLSHYRMDIYAWRGKYTVEVGAALDTLLARNPC